MSTTSESHETRKGRGEWSYWAGTPSDLAEIATLARELVELDGRGSVLAATITAPAFEGTYDDSEKIRERLTPEDLKVLTAISVEVDETSVEARPIRRIAVSIKTPPTTGDKRIPANTPVVRLAVTGPDRTWVDGATERMRERLDRGERATERAAVALAFIVALSLAGAIFFGLILPDEQDGLEALEWIGIVSLVVFGIGLLVVALMDTITPQLELLPDEGATRWARLTRRIEFSGRWLLDVVLKSAVGFVIGFLLARLLE